MARQGVDIGVEGNDGTGDSIRDSFRKVNENFQELYAVFGIGGQISFTDLSDTPNSYENNENKIPAVRPDGSGINLLELVSDGTIEFDFSVEGKVSVNQIVSRLSNDPEPILSGPLNAATQPIAGITVSQAAIDTFNSVYNTDFTIGDLVINKSFADRNYQTKVVAGGGVRLPYEPTSTEDYVLTASGISLGNLTIPDHGLSEGFNGAGFVFNSTGDDPSPADVISGNTYYIRVVDTNTISLYNSEQDVTDRNNRLLLSGGTGTFSITDAAFDEDLAGNWLANVALPRNAVVRRQGDTMEGILNLSNHPGDLAGTGLPNGPDDLQAATKLYVDNASAASTVNLYVTTAGSDLQQFTPDGKEGRSPGYAYRTINSAAEKAEEIIQSAPFEPGPYMQTLTYGNGAKQGNVVAAGITTEIAGRQNARELITLNKEFVAKEVTAYLDTEFPEFADRYNKETCQRDVRFMLDSVSLDSLLGNNANYLSRWAGIRYFSNSSARIAIGSQKRYTVAGINYARFLVVNHILANTSPSTSYQSRVSQVINTLIVPDTSADETIDAKFDIILQVIDDGVLSAPPIVDGLTNYTINVSNGNFGFIDQADPSNTDLIPGKVIQGRNSGAIGRIVDYKNEAGTRPVAIAETDEIEVQLLKPIEFQDGEILEYGNIVRETQVSIRVETGIYEEDYPIRMSANVSIKGDEFRRVIIRPKKRVSQSRWANLYFYRDAQFDGLVLGQSLIESIKTISPSNSLRVAGTYVVNDTKWQSDNLGKAAEFEVTVSTFGTITNVVLLNSGKDFVKNELIVIPDSSLGNGGAPDVVLEVSKVPNGIEYVNPLSGKVDGYFGYQYLLKPGQLRNTGAGYENVGNWKTASLALIDNREFIQEQVIEYINDQFPALNYDKDTFFRETGLTVDAMSKDLRIGGNEFVLEAQGEYYVAAFSADGSQTVEANAAIQYIATIANKLIRGESPDTLYGVGNEYTVDLFNGDANPPQWQSTKTYRLGDVVFDIFAGVTRFYTPTAEHTAGSTFDATEITNFWREIDGPELVISNLIDTVAFAFDSEYNPPLRNEEMDVFLMDNATIIRNVTVQGHGGFMLALDPEGQVLTKSPYIQTGSSFSQSLNKQAFRGGMFVDAFVGNSAVQVVEQIDGSPFRLKIQSLGSQADPQGLFVRRPQTPCAFYVDGRRFQVNAVTSYDPDFGTADLVLDASSNAGLGFTGVTSALVTGVDLDTVGSFEFDKIKCARDSKIILNGVGYDTALGTNYNSVYNGLAYQRQSASVVINNQQQVTSTAIGVGRDATLALVEVADSITASDRVAAGFDEVIDIIDNGASAADAIVFTSVPTDVNKRHAQELLQANRVYISTELTDWITANYAGLSYNQTTCQRDVQYIVDALSYDVQYGGNSATITNARAYFEEASVLPTSQKAATVAAYAELANIVSDIILESYPQQSNTGTPATATEVAELVSLVGIIEQVIAEDTINALPAIVYPDLSWVAAELQDARNDITAAIPVIVNKVVESVISPISITLQTAGNRSILGNDFTQINDLGYGLVVLNGALSEMVSMFTYYCWASYYAKNGAQIRSLTGSSCYGQYGLVAEGSDPNEIPDAITLTQDMVEPAKAFTADIILRLTGAVVLQEGDIIEQAGTDATATVSVNTSQPAASGSGSTTVYLKNPTGAFDTSNEISIVGPITGDSTIVALGAASVPIEVNALGFGNDLESLSIYLYDMKNAPSNRSELDLYHPGRNIFARYEVANVEDTGIRAGAYLNVGTDIAYSYQPGGNATGSAAGAVFNIGKTIQDGYAAIIQNSGTEYRVDDTFTISGDILGGDGTNDCTITVTEIDQGDPAAGLGLITAVSASGTIFIEATTATASDVVYRLNFSTGDQQFSSNGILEEIEFNTLIQYRRNQTHIISDLARPDLLTIRPSTAVIFKENPNYVYRSISFLTSDSLGNVLPDDTLLTGFDSGYDYIRLIVDSAKAQEPELSGSGTTKGNTIGDNVIALSAVSDLNEIFRLNNNVLTPTSNRPVGWTDDSLAQAPIIVWAGKQHYVYNFRGVRTIGGVETIVQPGEDNEYAIVDIKDVGIDINYPVTSEGLADTMVLGSNIITIRAGLKAGAFGTVTVNISTCRATSHDFLDIGTGGYNNTNYPNVIFGEPLEKNSANETEERGKGRVFYVSTDQNGVFRVGRFFSVDQGTGTVSFSASIALSDVDGIGFKRGVVVTEFSTDTAMTDNASDTVPTELAVRGYVNRRLGYDVTGNTVANRLGPGVLAPNGAIPMTGDLNAAGNTITSLSEPNSESDAATKKYVDKGSSDRDEIKDLRSVSYNDYDKGQLLVSTGYKRLIVRASSITGGAFAQGDTIVGSDSQATGTVEDVLEQFGTIDGDVIVIVYTPTSVDAFDDGKPAATSVGQDTVSVIGGAQGVVVDGPIDEWANGVESVDSDITVLTTRELTPNKLNTLDLQIKTGAIRNSDVNSAAGIQQSKLNLLSATTRADAVGIGSSEKGVASFDSSVFTADNGWISIANGSLSLRKIQRVTDGTVLGNWSGNTTDNDLDEIAFTTIVQQGGGLADADFASLPIAAAGDPGEALIKTGAGTYGTSNVSTTGEINSIVKTDVNGSIQVSSLKLGGNDSYEILSLETTTVVFKTPAQGEILRAVGGSGGASPTYPVIQMAGSLDIGGAGVSQSVLHSNSNFNGQKALAVDWIYSSFIEAPGEKGAASSGIAIGANTGKTTVGQVAIVTANTTNSSSVSPFIFSSVGAVPDIDNTYDIGSSTRKYDNVYANLFRGTATESYYADLAENYVADKVYEPGTVLVFGGNEEVTTTSQKDNFRVAGVVSTNPAHLMNTALAGNNVVALALQGRVPCMVIGKVNKGDIIVTSGISGHGCVNNNPVQGTMIGKAVGTKDTNDRGIVEVVVGR